MNYTWNVDGTQSEKLQATISIWDSTDKLTSKYIGEFTMFFNDEDEILDFLEAGLKDLAEHIEIMREIRPLESTARSEE